MHFIERTIETVSTFVGSVDTDHSERAGSSTFTTYSNDSLPNGGLPDTTNVRVTSILGIRVSTFCLRLLHWSSTALTGNKGTYRMPWLSLPAMLAMKITVFWDVEPWDFVDGWTTNVWI
jgi:hypothetical protein